MGDITLSEQQLKQLAERVEHSGEGALYTEAFIAGYEAAAARRELPPTSVPRASRKAATVTDYLAEQHAKRRIAVGEALEQMLYTSGYSATSWSADEGNGFRATVIVAPRDRSREPSMSHNPPVLEVGVGFAGHSHVFARPLPDTDSMYEAFPPPPSRVRGETA